MPVVYVIHADEDRAFVETRLIRPLPALGLESMAFERDVSRQPGRSAVNRSSDAPERRDSCGGSEVVVR